MNNEKDTKIQIFSGDIFIHKRTGCEFVYNMPLSFHSPFNHPIHSDCAELDDTFKMEKEEKMKYTEIYEMKFSDDVVVQKKLTKAEQKVWNIIEDLSDRRGLSQEWEQIDNETKNEIFDIWVNIIAH